MKLKPCSRLTGLIEEYHENTCENGRDTEKLITFLIPITFSLHRRETLHLQTPRAHYLEISIQENEDAHRIELTSTVDILDSKRGPILTRPITLEDKDRQDTDDLYLRVPICPRNKFPVTTKWYGKLYISLSSDGVLDVPHVIELYGEIPDSQQVSHLKVQKIYRHMAPKLLRINVLALCGLLLIIYIWNQIINQSVHNQIIITYQRILYFLSFALGFFGLHALFLVKESLGAFYSVWRYPEWYLPRDTVEALEDRYFLIFNSIFAIVILIVMILFSSVSCPKSPSNFAWFDVNGVRVLPTERVYKLNIKDITMKYESKDLNQIENSLVVARIHPKHPRWFRFNPLAIKCDSEFEQFHLITSQDAWIFLPEDTYNEYGDSAVAINFTVSDLQSNHAISPLWDLINPILAGKTESFSSKLVFSYDSNNNITARQKDLLTLKKLRRNMLEKWTLLTGGLTVDDILTSPNFQAEKLIEYLELPSDIQLDSKALTELYQERMTIFSNDKPATAIFSLFQLSALITLFHIHGNTAFDEELFNQFGTDFLAFCSGQMTSNRTREDTRCLRAFIRFLLDITSEFYSSTEVDSLMRLIQQGIDKTGAEIYWIYLEELIEHKLLFRQRNGIDVQQSLRGWFKNSVTLFKSSAYVQERLKDKITNLTPSQSEEINYLKYFLSETN